MFACFQRQYVLSKLCDMIFWNDPFTWHFWWWITTVIRSKNVTHLRCGNKCWLRIVSILIHTVATEPLNLPYSPALGYRWSRAVVHSFFQSFKSFSPDTQHKWVLYVIVILWFQCHTDFFCTSLFQKYLSQRANLLMSACWSKLIYTLLRLLLFLNCLKNLMDSSGHPHQRHTLPFPM